MEKNNGSEQVDYKKLLEQADPNVQNLVNNLFTRIKLLENEWMKDRVDYLFRVLECKEFNALTKAKAAEELETFLFPEVSQTKGEA